MDLLKILRSFEEFLFEAVSWLVFYPLTLWRILRGELKLQSYAFESCVSSVLRVRVPEFPAKTLSRWASA